MVVVEMEIMELCNILCGLLCIDVVMLVMLYFLMLLIKYFCEWYLEIMLFFVFLEMFINFIEWKVDVVICVGMLIDLSLCVCLLFISYCKIIVLLDYIVCFGKLEIVEELKWYLCLGFLEFVLFNIWLIVCSDG